MNEQRAKSLLLHILEDLRDIESFVQEVSQEEFEASSLLKKAVSMSLINIGELTRGFKRLCRLENRHRRARQLYNSGPRRQPNSHRPASIERFEGEGGSLCGASLEGLLVGPR
jgi:hypothetical protein